MHLAADELKVPDWLAMMGVVLAENMERAFVTLLVKVRFCFCPIVEQTTLPRCD